MKKWDVTIKRYYSVEVEAETEDKAKKKAESLKELSGDKIVFAEEIK